MSIISGRRASRLVGLLWLLGLLGLLGLGALGLALGGGGLAGGLLLAGGGLLLAARLLGSGLALGGLLGLLADGGDGGRLLDELHELLLFSGRQGHGCELFFCDMGAEI